MPVQTWKCLRCERTFKEGQWICEDGQSNHEVAEKTYRSLDATHDPGNPHAERDGRTRVCNIPPAKKVMVGNDVRWEGEGSVDFIRGRFSTTNPEIQYWLDKRPAYNATEEQWKTAWLTDFQQVTLEKMQLKADRERLEMERNELLAKTKKEKGAAA